jgi:TolA-binding protein
LERQQKITATVTVCVQEGPATQEGKDVKVAQVLPGGNCSQLLSKPSNGNPVKKKIWFASVFFIFIALAFPAYSWFDSLGSLSPKRENKHIIRKSITMAPLFSTAQMSPNSSAPSGKKTSQSPIVPRSNPGPKAAPPPQESMAQVVIQPVNKLVKGKKGPDNPKKTTVPTQPKKSSLGKEDTPNNTLFDQALTLHKKGKLKEAKTAYEKCLKRSPYLVSALNNLGVIHIQERNYTAAHDFLERATTANAAFPDAYYNLSCLYALQMDVEKGLDYLEKAVSRDASMRQRARADRDLENLRGHIEFERILADVKRSDKKKMDAPHGSASQYGSGSGNFNEASLATIQQPMDLPTERALHGALGTQKP